MKELNFDVPELAINPLEEPAEIIKKALLMADTQTLLLLVQQNAVKKYLRSIPRNHYIFNCLRHLLASKKNIRAACEFIDCASNGIPALLPSFLATDEVQKKPKRKSLLLGAEEFAPLRSVYIKQNREILFLFRDLKNTLAQGAMPLPEDVIHHIFDMAIGDDDYKDKAIAKQQILRIAKPHKQSVV